MTESKAKKYSGPFSPCCVCKTSPAFAIYDRDLEGFVCPECARNLMAAGMWLASARIEGCVKGRRG